jgi:hypothetical protein
MRFQQMLTVCEAVHCFARGTLDPQLSMANSVPLLGIKAGASCNIILLLVSIWDLGEQRC